MIYIHLEHASFQTTSDKFHVKTAKTVEEACKLVEVGFEYVAIVDGVQLFRKRKWLSKIILYFHSIITYIVI